MASISFLGFIVEKVKIKAVPGEVHAMAKWPVTTSCKQRLCFLGFVNFDRSKSRTAAPKSKSSKVTFVWTTETFQSFKAPRLFRGVTRLNLPVILVTMLQFVQQRFWCPLTNLMPDYFISWRLLDVRGPISLWTSSQAYLFHQVILPSARLMIDSPCTLHPLVQAPFCYCDWGPPCTSHVQIVDVVQIFFADALLTLSWHRNHPVEHSNPQ